MIMLMTITMIMIAGRMLMCLLNCTAILAVVVIMMTMPTIVMSTMFIRVKNSHDVQITTKAKYGS